MAKVQIPVEFTEKYTKDIEAIKDCIEFGHYMAYDNHVCIGTEGSPVYPITTITKKCVRCGFGLDSRATRKEIRALQALGLIAK